MWKFTIIIILSAITLTCISPQPEAQPKLDKSVPSSKPADNSYFDKSAVIYTTASDSELRISQTGTVNLGLKADFEQWDPAVFINPNKSFQTFIGMGGSITDAAAEVFHQMPEDTQEEFITAYFDPEKGIGYTLNRSSIHSCDFSPESFTYVEEGDESLETFSIDRDKVKRIPMIKRAMKAAGGELLFYASPWSPPAFMKTNKNMLQGGKLLPEYYDAWALYYTKFIKAYEAEGIPVWGITIQNEPMAVQRWESCVYTAAEERDFLKNHLGPIMEQEGLGDKNIVVWDHNRDLMVNRANTIFDDPEASKYAWGIGFHWYEKWTGGAPMYNNLHHVKESYPDKELLFTEGCQESFQPDLLQHWPHAERYGESIINDFNAGTVGWTDWNILLNQNGGPNHVDNYCFAPIHGNTETGELIYTPTYYYLGHFSKFIRPGAKRISTTTNRSKLLSTSFLNEAGNLVAIVMNHSDESFDYRLFVGSTQAVINIPANGIQTVVIK